MSNLTQQQVESLLGFAFGAMKAIARELENHGIRGEILKNLEQDISHLEKNIQALYIGENTIG